jgi:dGTPase
LKTKGGLHYGFATVDWKTLLCPERLRATTKEPEERRGEIHRDYGRVVFSTPVRRLQDKAQVFPLEPIDAVRTRLTHSLEVSSVARGLAHVVARELQEQQKVTPEQAYDIETIAATCGLMHDLGNPPFGHAGETAIRDWFKNRKASFWKFDKTRSKRYKQDLLNFEGNAQTLRLLTKLQILSDRSGLNLTVATLSASLKYTAGSGDLGKHAGHHHSRKKLGYFTSEESTVSKIRDMTGTGKSRNPITFLVEASDDMCYAVVDIEDAIKKGVISWRELHDDMTSSGSGQERALLLDCAQKAKERIDKAKIPLRGRSRDEALVQYFRTLVIVKGQDAVRKTFLLKYDEIMAGHYDREILYDSDAACLFKFLKEDIGGRYIYNAKGTLRLELLGRNVIHFLMDTFWQMERSEETKSFRQKTYNLLSQNYRTVFEKPTPDEERLPETYRKALLLTDYICGMTDSFALNLRRELQHG